VLFGSGSDGIGWFPGEEVPLMHIPGIGPASVVFQDAAGRIAGGITIWARWFEARGGVYVYAGGDNTHLNAYTFGGSGDPRALLTDPNVLYVIPGIGQSLQRGGVSPPFANLAYSTVALHPGRALMFDAGIRPDGAAVAGFVDLIESVPTGETISSGLVNTFISQLDATLGTKPRVLTFTAAQSNQSYRNLKRGSAQYTELLRLVNAAKALAALQGWRVIVPAVVMLHGEADRTGSGAAYSERDRVTYHGWLKQWQRHIDADIRAITGQDNAVRMLTYQTEAHADTQLDAIGPAMAQLDAHAEHGLIAMASPIYAAERSGDLVHPTGLGYLRIGTSIGRAAADDICGLPWEPLRPIRAEWVSDTVIRVRYLVPVSPLVLDESDTIVKVAGIETGKGFDFVDGSITPPTIAAVALTSGATNAIDITLSAAPTGRAPKLYYACKRTGTSDGPVTGARGLVRDSQSLNDTQGQATYNWSVAFVLDLPKP